MGNAALISRRKFLKDIGTAGAGLTLWAAGCGQGAQSQPGARNSVSASGPDTYRSAAKAGFEVLVKQYKTPDIFAGSFWWGGTTLHTCLNYLVAAKEQDDHQILLAGFDVYQDLLNKDSWWKDDYGWWGIAFGLAISQRSQLGYADASHDKLFGQLLEAMQSCWEQLENNWRNTPYNIPVDGGTSDNAAASADVLGGTFNNSPDSTTPPLSGRNCVTNEGFWILSQRLAQLIPSDPKYPQMAAAESAWFAQWLAFPQNNPGQTGVLNELGLVLERPTGSKADPVWFWSGDQGLLIQALTAGDPEASGIAQAVMKNMTDQSGVLHENLQFKEFPELQPFEADWATGKGILMRNLLPIVLADPASYSNFVEVNAAAVWCNRSKANQFTYNWNPLAPNGEPTILRVTGKSDNLCDLVMQAAGQEALNLAVYIAPDEPIDCPVTA